MNYPKMSSFADLSEFQTYLKSIDVDLPLASSFESGEGGPLARDVGSLIGTIGNRFAILPMEGWDGTVDGTPTDMTTRRWKRFGLSGAKLIWGGEAVAVDPAGRANPHQLMISSKTAGDLAGLRDVLVNEHDDHFGETGDLKVGLQLTHSGRFARPEEDGELRPFTATPNPVLDERIRENRFAKLMSDDEIDRLVEQFIASASLAEKCGFDFVDIKQCHGYFGHELLSGFDRKGKYGGSFENRTRFIRNIVEGINALDTPIAIGSRISIFDFAPFSRGDDGTGVSDAADSYRHAFGGDGTGEGLDLREPELLLKMLSDLGVKMICTSAGSPYYNPHIQRPATEPPSDGYAPPEEPLISVARQIHATASLKRAFPEMLMVGSAYSYLQHWLPHVAEAVVAEGWADFVGLGRMVLSYPDMPADVLAGRSLQRKKICRTFSDCTTAPRNGMVSGCFPLDPFYRDRPERKDLVALKRAQRVR